MKKLVTLTFISSFIFFSCATSSLEDSKNLTDTVSVEVSEDASDTYENNSETVPDSFSENESTSDSEDKSDISPDTTVVMETTSESEEIVDEAFYEPEYIPEEEKISDEEIKDDLAKLEENTEDNVGEIISETESTDTQNTTTEENKVEIKAVPDSPKTETTVASTKQEPKPVSTVVSKPEVTSVKAEPKKEVRTEIKTELKADEPESSLDLQKEAELAAETINNSDEPEKPPVPSRTISIKNNQYLDINYPGSGWVYLGEVERQNLLVFYGRKVNGDTTTFTLQSRKSGTAVLHFYKNDNLSGKYIDDYVEVSVNTDSATDNSHVTTPEYAKIVPPKPQKPQLSEVTDLEQEQPVTENRIEYKPQTETKLNTKSSEPDLNIQTIIQNANNQNIENNADSNYSYNSDSNVSSPAVTQTVDINQVSGDLLEAAQKAYNEKKFPDALSLVRKFLQDTSDRFDEGIFLEAQILEASSSVQDIKEAIKDYDTVIRNWPQSKCWKKANERSIYLKRFYIDIR